MLVVYGVVLVWNVIDVYLWGVCYCVYVGCYC